MELTCVDVVVSILKYLSCGFSPSLFCNAFNTNCSLLQDCRTFFPQIGGFAWHSNASSLTGAKRFSRAQAAELCAARAALLKVGPISVKVDRERQYLDWRHFFDSSSGISILRHLPAAFLSLPPHLRNKVRVADAFRAEIAPFSFKDFCHLTSWDDILLLDLPDGSPNDPLGLRFFPSVYHDILRRFALVSLGHDDLSASTPYSSTSAGLRVESVYSVFLGDELQQDTFVPPGAFHRPVHLERDSENALSDESVFTLWHHGEPVQFRSERYFQLLVERADFEFPSNVDDDDDDDAAEENSQEQDQGLYSEESLSSSPSSDSSLVDSLPSENFMDLDDSDESWSPESLPSGSLRNILDGLLSSVERKRTRSMFEMFGDQLIAIDGYPLFHLWRSSLYHIVCLSASIGNILEQDTSLEVPRLIYLGLVVLIDQLMMSAVPSTLRSKVAQPRVSSLAYALHLTSFQEQMNSPFNMSFDFDPTVSFFFIESLCYKLTHLFCLTVSLRVVESLSLHFTVILFQ